VLSLPEAGSTAGFRNVVLLQKLDDGQIWKKKEYHVSAKWVYLKTHVHAFLTLANESSASSSGCFVPGIHWIGGKVCPRAGLDAVYKRRISPRAINRTTVPPIPQAGHYAESAVSTPIFTDVTFLTSAYRLRASWPFLAPQNWRILADVTKCAAYLYQCVRLSERRAIIAVEGLCLTFKLPAFLLIRRVIFLIRLPIDAALRGATQKFPKFECRSLTT
jgi:hypothetical protein